MATTRDAEAVDAAAQAGEVLAPEASLLADTDAALLGRALQRASTALLRDPFTLARVSAQAATRAMTGMAATAARMIGSTAPAPFTPPAGDKRSSLAPRNARPATSRPSSRSPAPISTRVQRSASTNSRPIAVQHEST